MRHARTSLDPRQPGGWLVETERAADGRPTASLTAFLTNRECPWRCVFCDLWQFALDREVAAVSPHALFESALARKAALEAGAPPEKPGLLSRLFG